MNAFMIPVHQLIHIYKLKGAEGDVLAWTTSFMYHLIDYNRFCGWIRIMIRESFGFIIYVL